MERAKNKGKAQVGSQPPQQGAAGTASGSGSNASQSTGPMISPREDRRLQQRANARERQFVEEQQRRQLYANNGMLHSYLARLPDYRDYYDKEDYRPRVLKPGEEMPRDLRQCHYLLDEYMREVGRLQAERNAVELRLWAEQERNTSLSVVAGEAAGLRTLLDERLASAAADVAEHRQLARNSAAEARQLEMRLQQVLVAYTEQHLQAKRVSAYCGMLRDALQAAGGADPLAGAVPVFDPLPPEQLADLALVPVREVQTELERQAAECRRAARESAQQAMADLNAHARKCRLEMQTGVRNCERELDKIINKALYGQRQTASAASRGRPAEGGGEVSGPPHPTAAPWAAPATSLDAPSSPSSSINPACAAGEAAGGQA